MTRLTSAILLFLLLAGTLSVEAATTNPFISGKSAHQENVAAPGSSAQNMLPGFVSPMLVRISQWQLQMRETLVGYGHKIRTAPWSGASWMFLLLSFAYGVLHALGPGHGKLFAASYFMHQPGTLRLGLLFSAVTMFLHVLSATVLVLAGYFLLQTSGALTMDAAGEKLEQISYGLLCAMGLFLTIGSLLDLKKNRQQVPQTQRTNWKSFFGMALAAGIVPCPGAALVLIFAVTLNILCIGLLAMFAIALGMSVTTGAVSFLAISSRGALLRMTTRHERWYVLGHVALTMTASLSITLLGGLMLAGSLATG